MVAHDQSGLAERLGRKAFEHPPSVAKGEVDLDSEEDDTATESSVLSEAKKRSPNSTLTTG